MKTKSFKTFIFLFRSIIVILLSQFFLINFCYAQEETVSDRIENFIEKAKQYKEQLIERKDVLTDEALKKKLQTMLDTTSAYITSLNKYKESEEYNTSKGNSPNNSGKQLKRFTSFSNKVKSFLETLPDEAPVKESSRKNDDQKTVDSGQTQVGNTKTAGWVVTFLIILCLGVLSLTFLFFRFIMNKDVENLKHDLDDNYRRLDSLELSVSKLRNFAEKHLSKNENLEKKLVKIMDDINTNKANISLLNKNISTYSNNTTNNNAASVNQSPKIATVTPPQKTLTLAEKYNNSQANRSDKRAFSDGMITCSLKNAQAILQQNSDETPIFAEDNNGFFLISPVNSMTGDMVVIFGYPVHDPSQFGLLKTAFEVTRRRDINNPVEIDSVAKVSKKGNHWILIEKGKLRIQA